MKLSDLLHQQALAKLGSSQPATINGQPVARIPAPRGPRCGKRRGS